MFFLTCNLFFYVYMYIHFGFPIWDVPRLEYLHKCAQFQQIKRQTNQANLFYRNYPMYIHSVIYSDGGV